MKVSDLEPLDDAFFAGLPPARCDVCDELIAEVLRDRPCRAGCCTVLVNTCGHEFASYGPVDCPACSSWRSPRVRKLRLAYARRRR